jgi:hypothetical protein
MYDEPGNERWVLDLATRSEGNSATVFQRSFFCVRYLTLERARSDMTAILVKHIGQLPGKSLVVRRGLDLARCFVANPGAY